MAKTLREDVKERLGFDQSARTAAEAGRCRVCGGQATWFDRHWVCAVGGDHHDSASAKSLTTKDETLQPEGASVSPLSNAQFLEVLEQTKEHYPGPWEANEGDIRIESGALIGRLYELSEFPCADLDEDEELRFAREYQANQTLLAAAPSLLATVLDRDRQIERLERELASLRQAGTVEKSPMPTPSASAHCPHCGLDYPHLHAFDRKGNATEPMDIDTRKPIPILGFRDELIHEWICPSCRVERADYEGYNQWLPKCPNCGSEADPVPWSERAASQPGNEGSALRSEPDNAVGNEGVKP